MQISYICFTNIDEEKYYSGYGEKKSQLIRNNWGLDKIFPK